LQTYVITRFNIGFIISPDDGAISADACRREGDNTSTLKYTTYLHFVGVWETIKEKFFG